ncbi:MAG: hypothetical protein NTZ40_06980 [Cyanobacteria bacterium]|nr:hypothetical protein [Cyanobacteriota bacterium]
MIRFSAFSPKLALGAAVALAAISLSPGSAQAFVVNVGGMQYDVTTFTGTYDANTSKFATPANGGLMPWWTGDGNKTLASVFATQVGLFFGLPNSGLAVSPSGPAFGYRQFSQTQSIQVDGSNNPIDQGVNNSQNFTFAQATLYTATPAPAPLPLFGAAAAFGFSRKLRKRIKLSPGALGSALPQA